MEVNLSLQNIRFRIMNLPVDDSFKMLLLGDINLAIYYHGNQEIPGVLEYLSLLIRRISAPAPRYAFQNGHLNLLLKEVYSVMKSLTSSPYQAEPINSLKPARPKHSRAVPVPRVPEPVCQEPAKPCPVELEPEIPEIMEPEPIELPEEEEPMEQEPVELPEEEEPTEQEPIELPEEEEPMEQEPVEFPEEEEPMEQEPVELPEEEEPMEQEPVELPEEEEPMEQEPVEPEPIIPKDTTMPTNTPGLPKNCLRWNFPVSPSR